MPEFDYSQNGAYFVTLIAFKRQHLFGEIICGELFLNDIGMIVHQVWSEIPTHFSNVNNKIFIIMPNHLHGIIIIDSVGATHASPLQSRQIKSLSYVQQSSHPKGPKPGSLGAIIGSYKSAVSKRLHQIPEYHTIKIWQRNYYEHVIRDDPSLQQIVDYIETNPANWQTDNFYK